MPSLLWVISGVFARRMALFFLGKRDFFFFFFTRRSGFMLLEWFPVAVTNGYTLSSPHKLTQ